MKDFEKLRKICEEITNEYSDQMASLGYEVFTKIEKAMNDNKIPTREYRDKNKSSCNHSSAKFFAKNFVQNTLFNSFLYSYVAEIDVVGFRKEREKEEKNLRNA